MTKPRFWVPEVEVLRQAEWPNRIQEVRINGDVIPGVKAVTIHEEAGDAPTVTLTLVAAVRHLTKLEEEKVG